MKKQQLENSLNNIISSSTTTFSKVRGYSIDILYLLKEGMLTSSDIAELTGKYAQFINVYLNRLRKYGMVEKQGSFWKITEEGLYFLSHLESIFCINFDVYVRMVFFQNSSIDPQTQYH